MQTIPRTLQLITNQGWVTKNLLRLRELVTIFQNNIGYCSRTIYFKKVLCNLAQNFWIAAFYINTDVFLNSFIFFVILLNEY